MSVFNQTVELIGIEPYEQIINDKCTPFTLTINPSGLISSQNKVRAIEYIWGDEQKTFISYNVKTFSDDSLFLPNEVGSPLNYPQTHEFFSNDVGVSVYKILVNVYFFGISDVNQYTIKLNLKNPDLVYSLSGNNMFSDFRLIKTRMFDYDDTLLYVFQTQSPNYILMSNVKWKSLPETLNLKSHSKNRPYEFILPFINKNIKIPKHDGIKTIPYITAPFNPDNVQI